MTGFATSESASLLTGFEIDADLRTARLHLRHPFWSYHAATGQAATIAEIPYGVEALRDRVADFERHGWTEPDVSRRALAALEALA